MSNLRLRIPNLTEIPKDQRTDAPLFDVLRAAWEAAPGNGPARRPVGYVTRITRTIVGMMLFHHETGILHARSDGTAWITLGGFATATTVNRLNLALRAADVPVHVSRRSKRDGSVRPWYQVRTYDPATYETLQVEDYGSNDACKLRPGEGRRWIIED